MSKASNQQRPIASQFEIPPILYIPGLAHLFGINEAILLGQLLYWHGKGQYGSWTYKNVEELKKETGLSRSRQESAIRHLKALGIIEVELHKIPSTRHFRIDLEVLNEQISTLRKTCKLDYIKSAPQFAEDKQPITENTQDITPEITLSSVKKDFDTVEVFDEFFGKGSVNIL